MVKNVILFSAIIFLSSCRSEINLEHSCVVNTCLVQNPDEDLIWLKTRIDGIKNNTSISSGYFFVSMAVYKNNTVFVFENCCPFCDTIIIAYNCEGKAIGYVSDSIDTTITLGSGETISGIHSSLLKDKAILWKPKNFMCHV